MSETKRPDPLVRVDALVEARETQRAAPAEAELAQVQAELQAFVPAAEAERRELDALREKHEKPLVTLLRRVRDEEASWYGLRRYGAHYDTLSAVDHAVRRAWGALRREREIAGAIAAISTLTPQDLKRQSARSTASYAANIRWTLEHATGATARETRELLEHTIPNLLTALEGQLTRAADDELPPTIALKVPEPERQTHALTHPEGEE